MVDIKKQELKEAIESFYFAYRAFTAGPDRILEKKKLNRVHHRILYFVGRNPDITVNELLGILQVSKQALNAPLRKLMEKRLIAATTGAQDRRVKHLSLSNAGRKLEEELTRTQMDHLKKVFAGYDRNVFLHWQEIMVKTAGLD